MSSRALKKLVGSDAPEESAEVEDADEWTPTAKQSIFSMVNLLYLLLRMGGMCLFIF